jgi:transcriptional regulator with XRE-family HTH domain
VQAALDRLAAHVGREIREARTARRWTTQRLADVAGVSRSLVYQAERGEPISNEAAIRLSTALGLRLEVDLVDPRRRDGRAVRQVDLVHSAMGEYELRLLRALGFPTAVDDPYQHYQFAGRADVAAWDLGRRALVQIDNRTRFPDFQEMAGAYNSKRLYYGAELAARLGIRGWQSQTHLIAALWSAEVLHAIRLRPESFNALCPEPVDRVLEWFAGRPPARGTSSSLVLLDPTAAPPQRAFVGLEAALLPSTRPRYRGYADASERIADLAYRSA